MFSKLLSRSVLLMRYFPLRLTIGSGGLSQPGWIESDVVTSDPQRSVLMRILHRETLQLDATKPDDWETLFFPRTIGAIVSEHVFEHLTDAELQSALKLCRRYLRSNGRLRIAVPDGYRPDKKYIDEVTPPIDGHHQLFTIDSLSRLLQEAGFRVEPLEYYDRDRTFHRLPWQDDDGFINRCYSRDTQQAFRYRDHCYTSIIVDARPSRGSVATTPAGTVTVAKAA